MKKILLSICLVMICHLTRAQTSEDKITMSASAAGYDMIRLHNHNGNVTITPSNGNTITINATRKLKAKSSEKLKRAQKEVFLDSTVVDNQLIFFVNAPNRKIEINEDGEAYYSSNDWNNWSKSDIKKYDTEYEFIIEMRVPAGANLYGSTHHKDLNVKGINGRLIAKTHHGSVIVETGSNDVQVKSHHGDVTVNHTKGGVINGVYKTHHGDINTSFPSLSAFAEMDSYHGSFYTDFDFEYSASKVSTKESGNKTKYKYKGKTRVKIGQGGGLLTFKTHHGDTIISKR